MNSDEVLVETYDGVLRFNLTEGKVIAKYDVKDVHSVILDEDRVLVGTSDGVIQLDGETMRVLKNFSS